MTRASSDATLLTSTSAYYHEPISEAYEPRLAAELDSLASEVETTVGGYVYRGTCRDGMFEIELTKE